MDDHLTGRIPGQFSRQEVSTRRPKGCQMSKISGQCQKSPEIESQWTHGSVNSSPRKQPREDFGAQKKPLTHSCLSFLVFYSILVQKCVEGIRCHICKFSGSPDDWGVNCNDPFLLGGGLNNTMAECSMDMFYDGLGSIPPPNTTAFFCRKTVQQVEGKLLVKRSCGWEEYFIKGRECYHAGTLKFNTMSCVCYTDGCNSADTPSGLNSVFLSSLLLQVVLLIFQRSVHR